MSKIELNFHMYPLVVGQIDKYTFSGWEEEGGTICLKASLSDSQYKEEDIIWESSNSKIAVVNQGKVRALTTGIADITATLPDGACDSCRIQVIDNQGRITAQHVSLNTTHLILGKLEGAVLYPNILPVDNFDNGMLDKTFTWTSSNPDVAIVNHRGHVFGKECGTAVITGISNDVHREVSCTVEVIKKSKDEQYEDPLEDMDGGSISIKIREKQQLKLPKEVENQSVCFSSANAGIVSVDEQGIITAYREGSTEIFATFIRGGYRVHYQVQVEAAREHEVTEIHLNQYKKNLPVGEQTNIYAIVFPATLLEKQLEWTVSDSTIVKIVRQHINLSGLDEIIVEGVQPGNARITGSCEGKVVSCEVCVTAEKVQIEHIELPKEIAIEPEQVVTLQPVMNENATQKEVLWLSDNREIVTVDKDGVIKGYEAGNASIYCIATNSLSLEHKKRLKALTAEKCLCHELNDMEALQEILNETVYGVCSIHVQEESPCLFHLHIPEETITDTGLCLLWNRKSLLDTGEFDHYCVYHNEKLLINTKALSYTVKGLKENAEHVFKVDAVDANGRILASRQIQASTKAAKTVILDVTKEPYCAVGDGIATDTYAIQQAIDECPEHGVVLLPKGYVFLSGALFLKSHMTFQVDGILFGSQDAEDYPPIVCRWEGYRKMCLTEENQKNTIPVFDENVYSHASLINVGVYDEGEAGALSPIHTEDVTICGSGMINGNSFSLAYTEGPCWYIYRKGLPVPQSPKTDQNVRGRVLAFYNTRHAYVADVTVAYGPSWTIHPVFSEHITFDNVKVISMGNGRTGVAEGMLTLNGDGIDPDSSTKVNILHCYFTVGDDAVAIKSGRNRQGNELAKPSAYIRVTDCTCVDAKGAFCIGSEQAGGVHDVLFQNLKVERLKNFGLWIKSAPCRGGLVEDVLWRDCEIIETGGALQIEYRHGGDENPALELPVTRRVTYENIKIKGRNKFGIRIIGLKDSPIYDITFRGCGFEEFEAYKDRKFYLEDCHDIHFIDTNLPFGYEWEDKNIR